MSSDAEYYRVRAIEERELAAIAAQPNIVAIHLELAEQYEALAQEAGVQSTLRPGWGGPADQLA